MANPLPVPIQDPIANLRNWKRYPDPLAKSDPNENRINDTWRNFFEQLGVQAQNTPQFPVLPVFNTNQSASIGTTDIAGNLAGGVYRVSFAALITTAATVSSSLTVTFLWIANGITQSVSSAAITGNSTTTHASLSYVMNIDSSTPISFSSTYASSGATAMVYSLQIILENLNG
jgi:hypothetical protein